MDGKEHTRLISLKGDFMSWKIDDILYCAMNHLATVEVQGNKKQVYLTEYKYKKNRETLKNLCNCQTRALNEHKNRLISKNLITKGTIQKTDKNGNKTEISVYLFPQKVEPPYQIVNEDMLWYVASTRNHCAFQVYVYLLNKSKWKEHYEFTNDELQIACGYSENTNLSETIFTNILESFKREGIIDYYEKIISDISPEGMEIPKTHKFLTFIAEREEQLKKVN